MWLMARSMSTSIGRPDGVQPTVRLGRMLPEGIDGFEPAFDDLGKASRYALRTAQ
jgi:hypothetical protein